jgi:hypothetical protein
MQMLIISNKTLSQRLGNSVVKMISNEPLLFSVAISMNRGTINSPIYKY